MSILYFEKSFGSFAEIERDCERLGLELVRTYRVVVRRGGKWERHASELSKWELKRVLRDLRFGSGIARSDIFVEREGESE